LLERSRRTAAGKAAPPQEGEIKKGGIPKARHFRMNLVVGGGGGIRQGEKKLIARFKKGRILDIRKRNAKEREAAYPKRKKKNCEHKGTQLNAASNLDGNKQEERAQLRKRKIIQKGRKRESKSAIPTSR